MVLQYNRIASVIGEVCIIASLPLKDQTYMHAERFTPLP